MKWFTEGGDVPGGRRLLRSATRVFCPEAGGLCLAGGLLRARSKAISFCLEAGGLLRARSKARSKTISFCLKAVRAGPAVALSGKHNRPLSGFPQQKPFPDGPGAIRSCSTRLLTASLRLALENAFPSAFVMPPQGQNPDQGQRRFRSA